MNAQKLHLRSVLSLSSHQEKNPGGRRETSIRRILETRLSMIGYDVVTAADGEEALDTFRKADPNLVVLDVMMPKLDGYGVCQDYVRNPTSLSLC